MKPFTQYLYHTQKTYEFRIKLAEVDVSAENMARIKNALETYGVESLGKPKRMPIQEHPEFPRMGPCECHIFDVALKYPTTTEQLAHIVAERALLDKARVCVKTKDADDAWTSALQASELKDKPLLDDDKLEDTENAQELVGQKRVTGLIAELNKLTKKHEIAGKEETKLETTNTLPQNNKSPVGSNQNKIPSPVKGK